MTPGRKEAAEATGVVALHAELDRATRRLYVLHAERLQCRRGCSSCCVDGLTVFEVEAEPIRLKHAALLAEGVPHPEGACAFLDEEGGCRIYAERPYVCRTQGLPLRWLDEVDGEIVEMRDICPLNEVGDPVEHLAEEDCWTLGPFEERLAKLQVASRPSRPSSPTGPSGSTRTSLRGLFARGSPAPDAK